MDDEPAEELRRRTGPRGPIEYLSIKVVRGGFVLSWRDSTSMIGDAVCSTLEDVHALIAEYLAP